MARGVPGTSWDCAAPASVLVYGCLWLVAYTLVSEFWLCTGITLDMGPCPGLQHLGRLGRGRRRLSHGGGRRFRVPAICLRLSTVSCQGEESETGRRMARLTEFLPVVPWPARGQSGKGGPAYVPIARAGRWSLESRHFYGDHAPGFAGSPLLELGYQLMLYRNEAFL